MLTKITSYIDNLPLNVEPKGLYEPIRYVLSMGGKRLRPTLMMLAYEMWGGKGDDVLPQAIALETYHNFTLLHDDVMDHADVRRGMPTVHKKWDENTAILSGDNMLVLAFKWMQENDRLNAEDWTRLMQPVMQTFTTTAIEINHGQQYDVDFETRNDVTEAEYIEMIRLKTSVLLACAVKIGAIMAGAPQEDIDSLYQFGVSAGLAFQLQDDYLDVYGDPKVFGKAIGGDIACNKKTFMLINALLKADGDDKKELERWINTTDCDRDQKVAAVTALYNKLGIDVLAKQKIEEYFTLALSSLERVNLPAERKAALREYAIKLMGRNK